MAFSDACFFQYSSEEALLNDFELMLNNALHYNEEGSVVYQDAKKLDLVLKTKWKSMSQYHASAVKRSVYYVMYDLVFPQ